MGCTTSTSKDAEQVTKLAASAAVGKANTNTFGTPGSALAMSLRLMPLSIAPLGRGARTGEPLLLPHERTGRGEAVRALL